MDFWTEEKIQKLRELWKQGISVAQIGLLIGVSKNAISGKVHRLKLTPRASPIKPKSKTPRRKAPNRRPMPVQNRPPHYTQDRIVRPIDNTCCWPIGNPKENGFRICDAPIPRGVTYCETHAKRAYVSTLSRSE